MGKQIFFLIIITVLTYINILPNKLFFDDEELIYKNAYVQNLKYFSKYFTTNMIAGAGKMSNMYRPVLTASFAFDNAIWGNNPIGYHLTSIILHTANTILLYFLISGLFKSNILSFVTSLLFAVHPINSEAVTYASGRTDPLMFFFSFICIHAFLRALQNKLYKILWFQVSIFSFVLALLSKESAIILPFLLILIQFLSEKKLHNIIGVVIRVILFVFISLLYIILRLTVLNFANTLNFYPTPTLYSSNIFVRILTFTRVFFEYIGLMIFPYDLRIDRNSQILTTFLHPAPFGFILVMVTAIALAIIKWRKGNRIFFFCLVWFVITIDPVSGIIPINNVSAEHYLYLPSIAFFLIVTYVYRQILKNTTAIKTPSRWPNGLLEGEGIKKRIVISVGIITVFLLSLRSILRTFDWRDPITFYNISLKQSPNNIPMRNNLAMALDESGQTDEAISQYELLVKANTTYPQVYHNLGNAYQSKGRYLEAETMYKKAISIDSSFYFSYYALSQLYKTTGEIEKYQEIMDVLNQEKLNLITN